MSTSGSTAASFVAHLNKWSLNQSSERIDVTCYGDTNRVSVLGLPLAQGTFAGFWDDVETKPFVGSRSATGVLIYLYPSADAMSKFFCGPAWLDVSVEHAVDGAVTISGDFSAAGSWANGTI